MSYNNSLLGVSYLEFSFGYLEKSLLRISLSQIFEEDSDFFRLEPFETSLKNLMTFCRKVLKTKDEFHRISFALQLHYTVLFQIPFHTP